MKINPISNTISLFDQNHSHLPIGMKGNSLYQVHTVRIDCGDLIAFYTDGITEAMKGEEQFETEGLIGSLYEKTLLSTNKIIDKVFKDVYRFCESDELQDDASLILLKRRL